MPEMKAARRDVTPRVAMNDSIRTYTTSTADEVADEGAEREARRHHHGDRHPRVREQPADEDRSGTDLDADREIDDARCERQDEPDRRHHDHRVVVEQRPERRLGQERFGNPEAEDDD